MNRQFQYFLILIFISVIVGCNMEQPQIPIDQVENYTEEQESDQPPIINYGRFCEPKELIRNESAIQGYTDKQSYFPGAIVYFYIHSRSPEYKFNLYHIGSTEDLIESQTRSDGRIQNYLCYAYSWGSEWNTTFNYTLPTNLKSGYYSAEVKNETGSWWISFVVKEPVKSADIALIASTNTWCAYNDWGGGSYYANSIQEETRYSENISFLRPDARSNPQEKKHLGGSELHLVRWLENKTINYNLFTDLDLHTSPSTIRNYKVIILQTHPEYYTREMYNTIERYVYNGGKLMYLGGNGMYAKVVYNPNLKILETRKTGEFHSYENTVGGLWRNLEKPESAILGVAYDKRGFDTFHPYKVKNNNHWIFKNTGLQKDDIFGEGCGRNGASGAETDKIDDSSPKNLVHLAKGTNPDEGGADMIYYENSTGGRVFSVGSITYTSCINTDPAISQITENVLVEFLK